GRAFFSGLRLLRFFFLGLLGFFRCLLIRLALFLLRALLFFLFFFRRLSRRSVGARSRGISRRLRILGFRFLAADQTKRHLAHQAALFFWLLLSRCGLRRGLFFFRRTFRRSGARRGGLRFSYFNLRSLVLFR